MKIHCFILNLFLLRILPSFCAITWVKPEFVGINGMKKVNSCVVLGKIGLSKHDAETKCTDSFYFKFYNFFFLNLVIP